MVLTCNMYCHVLLHGVFWWPIVTVFRLVSSMGRADLLWPRVDLDLTRKVRSNTGRVNVDQRWARLEAGRGGDSFDPL